MSNPTNGRLGRGRRYALAAPDGFTHPDAARTCAQLDELRERLADLIRDVPTESLGFVPEGGRNSITMLVKHMAAGEAMWIARRGGADVPEALRDALREGWQDETDELPPSDSTADELIALCRRVRDEVTRPVVAPMADIDRVVAAGERMPTMRHALEHMVWHWTYHSGQVGLLRRLAGPRYKWTFADE